MNEKKGSMRVYCIYLLYHVREGINETGDQIYCAKKLHIKVRKISFMRE